MPALSATEETRTFELFRQVKTAPLTGKQAAELQLAESDASAKQASILVVDDSTELRKLMVYTLQSLGYPNIAEARDGQAALVLLRQRSFDLMVLDIEMPVMDGFQVLAELKKDPVLSRLPVIVASGLQELDAVVRCIGLGAEDFLPKPVNPVLLRARIGASLERTWLRERDRQRLIELHREKELLEVEREKSERLLLNILPAAIADRLKRGEDTIADRYAEVTVLFADLVGFTELVGRIGPEELVSLLSDLFSRFDQLAVRHRVEKIKTIGDCYLVVGGLPGGAENHLDAVADMALAMMDEIAALNRERKISLNLRIGMNSGPVVAGVIGRNKFAYDLWGATVNLASRMQSSAPPNRIHMPTATSELLRGRFRFTPAGLVACKGIGEVDTCLLERRAVNR
ncbi:MAG TPA: adenylate/guanylate cyclase domain-containing protein [Lacunisphaera sp.]